MKKFKEQVHDIVECIFSGVTEKGGVVDLEKITNIICKNYPHSMRYISLDTCENMYITLIECVNEEHDEVLLARNSLAFLNELSANGNCNLLGIKYARECLYRELASYIFVYTYMKVLSRAPIENERPISMLTNLLNTKEDTNAFIYCMDREARELEMAWFIYEEAVNSVYGLAPHVIYEGVYLYDIYMSVLKLRYPEIVRNGSKSIGKILKEIRTMLKLKGDLYE